MANGPEITLHIWHLWNQDAGLMRPSGALNVKAFMKPDGATLAGIASITAAFGATVLVFRVQREDAMRERNERVWLPAADWLLLAAAIISLLFVLVPIAAGLEWQTNAAASAASSICVAGYIPSILAHYRIVFGADREGPRDNPEPWECRFVIATTVVALAVGGWITFRSAE